MTKPNIQEWGIISLSVISVRKDFAHTSEMVTQALYGEMYKIIEANHEWTKIQLQQDNYIGWIPNTQVKKIKTDDFVKFKILANHSTNACTDNFTINLPIGSVLWQNVQSDSFFSSIKYIQTNVLSIPKNLSLNFKIVQTAKTFLNAPYLWGGKTIFGIDCSGLSQISYRVNGIQLPRDAYLQAELGDEVKLSDCKEGDLAFFNNEKDRITHVGIIYSNENNTVKIIHSSGKVKIDILDEKGIFIEETKQYTHVLKVIKRII
ncbi:MAG: C40 family peptidase [Chitinophagales bacterium]|nr:C40 family peptidase [Chitinophagales bacterium]